MTEQEIFKKLLEIFNETINEDNDIDISKINLDTNIFEDLNLDSISLVYFVLKVEEVFNIKFTNQSIKELKTVKDVISFIKLQQK